MLPILKRECMLFQMAAQTKQDAIKQMINAFFKEGYLNDEHRFYQDVLEREALFSTYIGYGIGFPHGKSSGANAAGLCIARLAKPVRWSENADSEVGLILMVAVKAEGENDLHLQILSRLSRLLMHEDFRSELMSGDREEIYRRIRYYSY